MPSRIPNVLSGLDVFGSWVSNVAYIALIGTLTGGCAITSVRRTNVLEESSSPVSRQEPAKEELPSAIIVVSSSRMSVRVTRPVHCFQGSETTRTSVDVGRKPINKMEDPEVCGQEPFRGAKLLMNISGVESWECATDDEGKCEFEFSEEVLSKLFLGKEFTVSLVVNGTTLGGDHVSITMEDSFEEARRVFLKARRQEQGERMVVATSAVLDSAKSFCQNRKADLVEVKKKLSEAQGSVAQLKEYIELPVEISDSFTDVKDSCTRHAERLTKRGCMLGSAGELREALEYFNLVVVFWPDSEAARAAKIGIVSANEVLEKYKPQRIKELVAYTEGDGLMAYIIMVNKEGLHTRASGTVAFGVYLRNEYVRVDRCFERAWNVSEVDFEVMTVGTGVFQREVLALRLPFIKWRDMQCHAVQTYLQMGGIPALEQLTYQLSFSAEVMFQTEDGEKLEAQEEFQP